MHLKSCCALLLLALVACQAAPSAHIIEKKSISEEETKLVKDNLKLEDTGAEKERAKKSTTFCVEIRKGKEEQVPCSNNNAVQIQSDVQSSPLQQVTLLPTNIQQAPSQPQSQSINVIQQQQSAQSAQISYPQPVQNIQVYQPPTQSHSANIILSPQSAPSAQSISSSQQTQLYVPQLQMLQVPVAPVPAPAPVQQIVPAPAPAPVQQVVPAPQPIPSPQVPIINLLPAPVSQPCAQTQSQPQQVHTIHLVQPQQSQVQLQPQPQPQPQLQPQAQPQPQPQPQPQAQVQVNVQRPVYRPPQVQLNVDRPVLRPQPQPVPRPSRLLAPTQNVNVVPIRPTPSYETNVHTELLLPQINQPIVPASYVYNSPTIIPAQESSYECSCRSENHASNPRPSKLRNSQAMMYPLSGSIGTRVTALQYNPNYISDEGEEPVVLASYGFRNAEARHRKYPVQVSVQLPPTYNPVPTYQQSTSYYPVAVVAPSTIHDSYSPINHGFYPAVNIDTYPSVNYASSSLQNYGSQSYGTIPSVPSVNVNAGGPFYRNAEHNDESQKTSSTASEVTDSSTQKREADLTQLNDNKQKEVTQMELVKKQIIIAEETPKNNEVESTKQKQE